MKNKKNDDSILETANKNVEFENNKKIGKKSNFLIRFCSSIVLLFILVVYAFSGHFYVAYNDKPGFIIFSYLCIGISCLIVSVSLIELLKSFGIKKWYLVLAYILMGIGIVLFPMSKNIYNFSFYINRVNWVSGWEFSLVLLGFVSFNLILFAIKKNIRNGLLFSILGIIIILAYKSFSIISLRIDSNENNNLPYYSFNTNLWIWLIAILSDTFAYFGGSKFGKTKLAPSISPNKSWEGAICGFLFSFVFSVVYTIIFYFVIKYHYSEFRIFRVWTLYNNNNKNILIYILLSIALPIISIFGDLLFSYNKRVNKIKDYSNFIPGHGGLLDRLDSVTLCYFVIFILVYLLG